MVQYITSPGESVAGIALRELGDENRWVDILAANPKFEDHCKNEYFPVGTKLTLPEPK